MAIKKVLLLGAALAVLAAGASLYAAPRTAPMTQKQILLGTTAVTADVADTDTLREYGLSGRTALPEGTGMLFVFDTDDLWGIWMKDMHFSIDIVWADAAGKVITVAPDTAPGSYPKVFYPAAPARFVVELPSGFAAAHGIAEGVQIVI